MGTLSEVFMIAGMAEMAMMTTSGVIFLRWWEIWTSNQLRHPMLKKTDSGVGLLQGLSTASKETLWTALFLHDWWVLFNNAMENGLKQETIS